MQKSEEKINIRGLIRKLGYDLKNGNHPAYTLALCLHKLAYDRDRIIQAITLCYPIQKGE